MTFLELVSNVSGSSHGFPESIGPLTFNDRGISNIIEGLLLDSSKGYWALWFLLRGAQRIAGSFVGSVRTQELCHLSGRLLPGSMKGYSSNTPLGALSQAKSLNRMGLLAMVEGSFIA